jgi:hypothetical protein
VEDPLADLNVAADVLSHHGLRSVIEQLPRNTPEVRERRPVARPERDEILRAGQPTERIPGMAEDHVEAVQRQLQPELVRIGCSCDQSTCA